MFGSGCLGLKGTWMKGSAREKEEYTDVRKSQGCRRGGERVRRNDGNREKTEVRIETHIALKASCLMRK